MQKGMAPLSIAAARGNLAMVYMCLKHGALVNALDNVRARYVTWWFSLRDAPRVFQNIHIFAVEKYAHYACGGRRASVRGVAVAEVECGPAQVESSACSCECSVVLAGSNEHGLFAFAVRGDGNDACKGSWKRRGSRVSGE
jgi:hypothetical protein